MRDELFNNAHLNLDNFRLRSKVRTQREVARNLSLGENVAQLELGARNSEINPENDPEHLDASNNSVLNINENNREFSEIESGDNHRHDQIIEN